VRDGRRDILPERLNAPPVIFRGCSSRELGVIVLVAIGFWLPVSLALAAWLGAVTMGFGLAGIGIVGTVVGVASVLQRLKRNRPEGFYQQWIALWLHRKRICRSPLIARDGYWDLGRGSGEPLPPRDR
jgi:conjugative transfer region protein (TIGR03750 family)